MLQPAALQVALERLPHMTGQLLSGVGKVFDKNRIMGTTPERNVASPKPACPLTKALLRIDRDDRHA